MEILAAGTDTDSSLNFLVMCTFLHHSDPSIPHYRKDEWSFLRGVVATVDRPLLGWIGRFFFHNVSGYTSMTRGAS